MADTFGITFSPTSAQQQDDELRQGSPLQQAIQFLSLRMPRILGSRPIAPELLLHSQGGGGGMQPNAVVQSILAQILGRAGMGGMGAMGGGAPNAAMMGGGARNAIMGAVQGFAPSGQAPTPRVIPGIQGDPGAGGMPAPPTPPPSAPSAWDHIPMPGAGPQPPPQPQAQPFSFQRPRIPRERV